MDKCLLNVPLWRIRPSRFQPRTVFDTTALFELAQSIEAEGLIDEPIVFAPDDLNISDVWELIAGERRVRATIAVAWAKLDPEIGLLAATTVLAEDGFHPMPGQAHGLLKAAGVSIVCRVQETADMATIRRQVVIEGLQRANLTPIEEARALQALIVAESLSQREIAAQIGKSQGYIQQRLSLLGMPPQVQEAVASERISTTQARAIAAAPKPLMDVLAREVTRADEAGERVSTRELELATRELTRFTDPDRWIPNAETIYRPAERNHLDLMRRAMRLADLEAAGDKLLALRSGSEYDGGNLLSKSARTIAASGRHMTTVLQALGYKHLEQAWQAFAEAEGRQCEYCVFKTYPDPPAIDKLHDTHCPRWQKPETKTCHNYLGDGDPVIIPVDEYWISYKFTELGVEMKHQPFSHMQSIPDYIKAYRLYVEDKSAQEEQAREARQQQHITKVREYMEWQMGGPSAVLDHPQAHACDKCVYQTHDSSCRFINDPLSVPVDKDIPRAPRFGMLIAPDGRLLPRCEMFAFENVPRLYAQPGWRIGLRSRFTSWLYYILHKADSRTAGTPALSGFLTWLPYNRPKGGNSYLELMQWIQDNWDPLGGDEVMGTLMDAAIAETAAMDVYDCQMIQLYNVVTGEHEIWVPVDWSVGTGETELNQWRLDKWPEGFPRPWEIQEEPNSELDAMTETEYRRLIEGEFGPEPRPALSHRELAEELQIPINTVAIVRELRAGETFLASDFRRRYNDDLVAAARLLAKARGAEQPAMDAIDEDVIMAVEEADAGRILTPEVME